jgi:hypothetical protein
LGTFFKKACKSVFVFVFVVSHNPLSPTPSTSSARKTSENAEEDPDNTEPADGDIQMEDFPAELYSQSIGAVTNNYL